jgi:hypothetical protein
MSIKTIGGPIERTDIKKKPRAAKTVPLNK